MVTGILRVPNIHSEEPNEESRSFTTFRYVLPAPDGERGNPRPLPRHQKYRIEDESTEGRKMTNNEGKLSKLSAAIEKLKKLGVRVTDGTCKGMAIGIVGGVRRSESKSAGEDDPPIAPRPSVN